MQNNTMPRAYMIASHAAMLITLLLSILFAEERVLLTDSAYQLFYDVNHESMLINDNRFSMVLSQLLPWLFIKMHMPLKMVLVGYSVSFVIICYACFLLAVYWLDNKRAAVLMIFTFLAIKSTFFHCISETFQLMFFAPLLFALASSEKRGPLYWTALALSEAAAFFIHPIALFFILFIIGFRATDGHKIHFDAPLVVTSLLLAVLMAIKIIAGQSGHDAGFMPTAESLSYSLHNFFHLNSIRFFYNHFAAYYLFPFLLWVITLVGYCRTKRWLKLAFVGLFVVLFFAMSVVVYWEGDGPIGMERTYLPLLFFIGLAFLFDELPRLYHWQSITVNVLFIVLLAVSLTGIALKTRTYSQRLDKISEIATQARAQGQYKLIVTHSTASEIFPIINWGLALESMIYTAMDGAGQTVTIYMEDDDFDRTDDLLYNNPEVYVSVNWWKQWEVRELNPSYFSLPPQGYKEVVRNGDGYEFRDL